MTEDPGDGDGERVVTHSLRCPDHPEYEPPLPDDYEEQQARVAVLVQQARTSAWRGDWMQS
jgi:hypothetical protein